MMQSLVKFKNKKKGFTLVELIVVIAIIGILAAILMPKFFGFTDDARKSAAVSEAKSIRSIAESYYAQNGKWPLVTSSAAGAVTKNASDPAFTKGTATSQLAINGTGTIDSPTFQGVISTYGTSATYPPVKVAGLPDDGSFNYTSNTGHTVKCDPNGTVTDID